MVRLCMAHSCLAMAADGRAGLRFQLHEEVAIAAGAGFGVGLKVVTCGQGSGWPDQQETRTMPSALA